MSENELKPCPFCGTQPLTEPYHKRMDGGVSCANGECIAHWHAIEPEMWNRRHTPPPSVVPESVRRDELIGLLLRFVGVPNAGTMNDDYYRDAAKQADKFLALHPSQPVAHGGLTNGRGWTKERPKREGWYWMRAPFLDCGIHHTTEIAKIFQRSPLAKDDPEIEFSGPIPPPPSAPQGAE